MPSFSLSALQTVAARPVVVTIAHLPILLITLFVIPLWMVMALWRKPHAELTFRLVRELRGWSREIVTAVYGAKTR